jgi:hypothetical protein
MIPGGAGMATRLLHRAPAWSIARPSGTLFAEQRTVSGRFVVLHDNVVLMRANRARNLEVVHGIDAIF